MQCIDIIKQAQYSNCSVKLDLNANTIPISFHAHCHNAVAFIIAGRHYTGWSRLKVTSLSNANFESCLVTGSHFAQLVWPGRTKSGRDSLFLIRESHLDNQLIHLTDTAMWVTQWPPAGPFSVQVNSAFFTIPVLTPCILPWTSRAHDLGQPPPFFLPL